MTEAGVRDSQMETENTESHLTCKHTDARAHTYSSAHRLCPPPPKGAPRAPEMDHMHHSELGGAKASYPVTNISTPQCQRRKLRTSQSKGSIYLQ